MGFLTLKLHEIAERRLYLAWPGDLARKLGFTDVLQADAAPGGQGTEQADELRSPKTGRFQLPSFCWNR